MNGKHHAPAEPVVFASALALKHESRAHEVIGAVPALQKFPRQFFRLVRRPPDAEFFNGVLFKSALLQIFLRDRRCRKFLFPKVLRRVVQVIEQSRIFILVRIRLPEFHARFFRKHAERVAEFKILVAHQKREVVPPDAASETVPRLPVGRHHKGRRFLAVERAERLEILPGGRKRQIPAEEVRDVQFFLDKFGG